MPNSLIYISVISFVVALLCILSANRLGIGVDSIYSTSPQKMHQKNTSRLGGLGIFLAFCIGYFFFFNKQVFFVVVGLFIVFISGFLEDLYGMMKPTRRLAIQLLGVMIMFWGNLGVIQDLQPLVFLPLYLGILFSAFGIVGVCNALNIIDGLNGLASGIALLVLGSIAYISKDMGGFVYIFSLLAFMGVLGFFVLNFPFGKIFLGDGGAYFLGALIGFLLGVLSNEGISAWFGLSVMIYPVWEVLYSIFRRKASGKKAMQPDGLHLHSLLFKLTKNNPLSTSIILLAYGIYLFCVLNFAKNANDFIIASLCFIVFYLCVYVLLKSLLKAKCKDF